MTDQSFLIVAIYLDDIQTQYTRKVYGLFDALSEIGGIERVLTFLLGLFLIPLNERLSAINLL